MAVSATLAINEVLAKRQSLGLSVLPMGFGEAGLPVHPALREVLAQESGCNAYGPVAGCAELRAAAAGYWERRGLPTNPDLVLAGPGSKSLLYTLQLSVGGDVVVSVPSWVSYAAQTHLAGHWPIYVPSAPGQGGVPQPRLVESLVHNARRLGRDIRAIVVTTPDNPTGTVACRDTVAQIAEVSRELDLVIISDEIYRDLVHDASTLVHSPAEFAPERTVVTTGLSKNLALGGWRLGLARFPDSPKGHSLYRSAVGIASEIWSSPSAPVQRTGAYALSEPNELVDRVDRSRRLHAAVVQDVADHLSVAGTTFPTPKAAFYVYPDFHDWRDFFAEVGVTTGAQLANFLLHKYGLGSIPAAEFEGGDKALRLRLATSLLYGDTEEERDVALSSEDPTSLPWIRAHLDRFGEILVDIRST